MDTIFQISKPTISKPTISLADIPNDTQSSGVVAGNTSPLIQLGGTYFRDKHISGFELTYGEELLPKIRFTLLDKNDTLSVDVLNELELVDVFIKSPNTDFEPIHASFTILEYQKLGSGKFRFHGELFIPDFKSKSTKSYKGTSFEVANELADEIGLGFASNVVSSNDSQIWLRLSQDFQQFSSELLSHGWNSDGSDIRGWVDIYYVYNYFDVSQSKSVSKDDFDRVTETNLAKNQNKEKPKKLSFMYLSNDSSKVGTYNFLEWYIPFDKRGDIEKRVGFQRTIQMFDVDSKEYVEYDIEHETTESRLSRHTKNNRVSNLGFLNKNSHLNYTHASIQNKINKTINNAKGLKCGVKGLNPMLYVGINIPIIVILETDISTERDNRKSGYNESISGNYIVTSLSFVYDGKLTTKFVGILANQ